jgi:hypothetical protein
VDSGLISEHRNVALSLCSDGFNPWNKRKPYSIWPIMFQVLNLPEHLRRLSHNIILAGIIDGPHEPKCMSTYLSVIVQQLRQLDHGVVLMDRVKREPFVCRARLLFTVADYPGHGKINGQQSAGTNGCIKCAIKVIQTAWWAPVGHVGDMSGTEWGHDRDMHILCR